MFKQYNIREIIDGNFTEGSRVTVNIDGRIVTRVVRWSGEAKDLFITVNKSRYFYYEFI